MTYQEPWLVKGRYVSERFIEGIEGYGEPGEYTVLYNCKTGKDIICRRKASKWQDPKTYKMLWRDEWMPEMTIVKPNGKNQWWYDPPIDYWLRELRRTDIRRQPKRMSRVLQDMVKEGDYQEEQKELKEDEEVVKAGIDYWGHFRRTNLTMPDWKYDNE